MVEYVVGSPAEFPEGEGVRVDAGGISVALFNLDGEFFAVSDRCPHKGAPLSLAGRKRLPVELFDGETRGDVDPEGREIRCPWHGLRFDLGSGECPSAPYGVRTFDVRVEDDRVTVVV